MKILISGDKHLGLTTEGDSRLDEQIKILDFCQEQVEKVKPDIYVDLGDLFDKPRPGPMEHALALNHAMSVSFMCASAVFLTGNHDKKTRGHDHALLPLSVLAQDSALRVCSEPHAEYLDHEHLALFLPYVTDFEARANGYECAQEWLDNFANVNLNEQSAKFLVFAHLEVHGASKGEDVRDVGLHVPRCLTEAEEVLGVWCGHVHTPQEIGKITIVGSAVQASFSEAGEQKALVLVEL